MASKAYSPDACFVLDNRAISCTHSDAWCLTPRSGSPKAASSAGSTVWKSMIVSVTSYAAMNAKAWDNAILRSRASSSDNQTPTKKASASSARWMNCARRSRDGTTHRNDEELVNLYNDRINRTNLAFRVAAFPCGACKWTEISTEKDDHHLTQRIDEAQTVTRWSRNH